MYLIVLFLVIFPCFAIETDLTVDIAAGKMECFFENIKKPTTLEVEYQVIDGGDLDINFYIQAPDGKVLISEHKKSDNLHKLNLDVPGNIKLCFDNTFSHFSNKIVFFEIVSDDDDDDDDILRWAGAGEELQQIVDMTLDDFKLMLERITTNLDKSRNIQTVLKMYEARDRNIVENNFSRVNFFSCTQLVIMVLVGLMQVILIRSLFDDKSRLHGMMKAKI